jgi:co-chaperonin GroES (HSP10)
MKEIFEPLGPRIKVKVSGPEEIKSSGGIILETAADNKTEDNELGIVVELGKYSYGNFEENWCDVGDVVLFQRYAGKPREEIQSDGSIGYYRILKDIDVIARVKK